MERRPTLQIELLYCKKSLVSVLLGVALGHRDHQTSPSQTSVEISQRMSLTYEAWRKQNTTLNRLLLTLAQKHFAGRKKHYKKGGGGEWRHQEGGVNFEHKPKNSSVSC
jgi:hypothetical protein